MPGPAYESIGVVWLIAMTTDDHTCDGLESGRVGRAAIGLKERGENDRGGEGDDQTDSLEEQPVPERQPFASGAIDQPFHADTPDRPRYPYNDVFGGSHLFRWMREFYHTKARSGEPGERLYKGMPGVFNDRLLRLRRSSNPKPAAVISAADAGSGVTTMLLGPFNP